MQVAAKDQEKSKLYCAYSSGRLHQRNMLNLFGCHKCCGIWNRV